MRSLIMGMLAVVSLLSSGCAFNIAETKLYPETPGAGEFAGKSFCAELESKSSNWSLGNAIGGWTFAVLGTGTATAGTIMTTANAAAEGGGKKEIGIAGAALIAGSALMLPGALAFFSRSDAAAALGSEANRAMLEKTDKKVYERCVKAKAAWIASRADANAIAREVIDTALKDKKDAETEAAQEKFEVAKKVTEANEKTEAAKRDANAANGKVDAAEAKATDAEKKLRQIKEALQPKKNSVPREVWEMLPPDPR